MITVNIKANPGLYEACKITDKKDKRKYIQVLHVKDKKYFATNSVTMLIGDTNLKDGQYFIIKLTKTTVELLKTDETFDTPDFLMVIDQIKDYCHMTNRDNNLKSVGSIVYNIAKEYNTALNPFLLDVVDRNIKQLQYIKIDPSGSKPVGFVFNNFEYIVMPLYIG